MKFKQTLSFLLTLVMIMVFSTSLAESYVMAGFDGPSSTRSWEENEFFARREAETGISFTFLQYNDTDEWIKAKTAILDGSMELPDVLFKASLTDEELITGLDSGKLIDLAPLLQEYAPNVYALLQEHPDWLEAVTLPDGRIGALPCLTEMNTQNAMWINTEWLEKLKLDIPTDMESLKQVLIAFRDSDPNGNGKKDEIPMSFLGPWELKFFSHAYGVVVNNYNLYQDDEGAVHYWPLEDSFVELAKTLREFYTEGLIDENGFTTSDTLRAISDSDADLTYGAFFAPTPLNLVTADMGKQFSVMMPFVYEGQQVYRDLDQNCITGAFAITTACENPEKLLAWIDALYTEEGAIEAMVGEEGGVWSYDGEGKWSYAENISTTELNTVSIYDSGTTPWYFPKDFYRKYNDAEIDRLCSGLDDLAAYVKKPTGRVIFQGAERQRLIELQSILGAYVDVTFAGWIVGDEPINEETVAAFRQNLENKGVQEMIKLWENELKD